MMLAQVLLRVWSGGPQFAWEIFAGAKTTAVRQCCPVTQTTLPQHRKDT